MPLRWRAAREQSADLVQIASAEIDWLYDYIAKSGYALVLTDASGIVLYEKTDATLADTFRNAGLIVRRGLERASRGNERHRHLHRREPVGDRAPGRTLSLLPHRPVLFRRAHSGSGRFAGGGARRLHVERAIHARRRRAHDGAGEPVRAPDRKVSVPAALPAWRRVPLPRPAGVREPAARRRHRARAGCHDHGGRRDRDAIAACARIAPS